MTRHALPDERTEVDSAAATSSGAHVLPVDSQHQRTGRPSFNEDATAQDESSSTKSVLSNEAEDALSSTTSAAQQTPPKQPEAGYEQGNFEGWNKFWAKVKRQMTARYMGPTPAEVARRARVESFVQRRRLKPLAKAEVEILTVKAKNDVLAIELQIATLRMKLAHQAVVVIERKLRRTRRPSTKARRMRSSHRRYQRMYTAINELKKARVKVRAGAEKLAEVTEARDYAQVAILGPNV